MSRRGSLVHNNTLSVVFPARRPQHGGPCSRYCRPKKSALIFNVPGQSRNFLAPGVAGLLHFRISKAAEEGFHSTMSQGIFVCGLSKIFPPESGRSQFQCRFLYPLRSIPRFVDLAVSYSSCASKLTKLLVRAFVPSETDFSTCSRVKSLDSFAYRQTLSPRELESVCQDASYLLQVLG